VALTIEHPPGATPLDRDETEGLIPEHIHTQGELNEWEQRNILEGERWAFGRKHRDLLTPDFVCEQHKRMFGQTWKWAGKYRTTEKNIGIDPVEIAPAVKDLCEDAQAQLANKAWSLDEIAARLHHRLTLIHPFPNGNGRHARTMADLVLAQNGAPRFTWGVDDLVGKGDARERYIAALQKADRRDYSDLVAFARAGRK
jgi:Fic-DOC domain mobile mystery protein B